MPEVSPSTAVGTRGSLGTAGGNVVRKLFTFNAKDEEDKNGFHDLHMSLQVVS